MIALGVALLALVGQGVTIYLLVRLVQSLRDERQALARDVSMEFRSVKTLIADTREP